MEQEISCAQPFRNHQNMARCDDLIRRHEHQYVAVLEYSRNILVFAAYQLSDTILRVVFAIEPGISPGRRKFVRGNLLRGKRSK